MLLSDSLRYGGVWRHGGLIVSALVLGSSGLGSNPGRGHCVVFLAKTLYSSQCLSLPGSINVYRRIVWET